MSRGAESTWLALTICVLPHRYDLNQTTEETPRASRVLFCFVFVLFFVFVFCVCVFFFRMTWSTVSKAFCKSIKIIPVQFPTQV